MPATRSAPSALTMGPYADVLNDQQIADVVSFIQTSWGNQGAGATKAQLAKMRRHAIPMQGTTAASFARGRPGTVPPQEVPHTVLKQ